MTETEIFTELLKLLDEGGPVELYEFARQNADRLCIPLPDSWVPTVERDRREAEAVEAGWVPKWRD